MLEEQMYTSKLDEDFAALTITIRDTFLALFPDGIIPAVKKMVVDKELLTTNAKLFLKDLTNALTTDLRIIFTGYRPIRSQSYSNLTPLENLKIGNINMLPAVDEVNILLTKYSVKEVIEILIAIRNTCYDIPND